MGGDIELKYVTLQDEYVRRVGKKEETIQAWEDSLALLADKYVKKVVELYNVKEDYLLGLDK